MNKTLISTLVVVGIPTLYALILRLFFGVSSWGDLFTVMSITFLFLVPSIVGALTVYLSKIEKATKISYRIFMPWVPIFFFFIITLILSIEGWACWLMILPIFLIFASLGGILGGYLKTRKYNNRLQITLLMIFPLILSPIENLIETIPGVYEAYTYIDIDAPVDKIWDNVTRVSEITFEEDKGYLNNMLGLPRPIRAELLVPIVRPFFLKGLFFMKK